MATNKNAIIVYRDWKAIGEALTDEQFGRLMKHFFSYVNDEDPVLEDPLLKIAWIQIEQALKRDLKKWEAKSKKNSENAKKRWQKEEAKDANASERMPIDAKDADNGNDNGNGKGNDKVKKNIDERKADFAVRASELCLPTLEQEEMFFDFLGHWTEHGERDRKMRFEKQTSFDVKRRWGTWKKNQARWEKKYNKDNKKRTASVAWRELIKKQTQ